VRSRRPDIVVMAPTSQSQAVAAVQRLMAHQPVPILVIKEEAWSEASMVKAGAVESIAAPDGDQARQEHLRSRVRLVSQVKTIRHIRGRDQSPHDGARVPIVAIAASTGGPQAVIQVLEGLAGLEAAVLVVQHLHPNFTSQFVEWIARASPLEAGIATDGALAESGHVYVAPAGSHLKLGIARRLELSDSPASLHRPSADVLFSSIAMRAGHESVGVLLTGMGDDGASGLLEMRHAGAYTIAQDKESSVIYGMPGAAMEIGAADHVLPLAQIAGAIRRAVAMVD
jgi:two-component system, chemotaxis family, protein-glutamate methylesterase/glutaminase